MKPSDRIQLLAQKIADKKTDTVTHWTTHVPAAIVQYLDEVEEVKHQQKDD